MTMPHLMNCSHSDTGWCLECVKEAHNEAEKELSTMKRAAEYLYRKRDRRVSPQRNYGDEDMMEAVKKLLEGL